MHQANGQQIKFDISYLRKKSFKKKDRYISYEIRQRLRKIRHEKYDEMAER